MEAEDVMGGSKKTNVSKIDRRREGTPMILANGWDRAAVGRWVTEVMEKKRITQADLAERTGLPRWAVHSLQHGDREIHEDELRAIEAILGDKCAMDAPPPKEEDSVPIISGEIPEPQLMSEILDRVKYLSPDGVKYILSKMPLP